jgi:glycosyltransferase involved in cell wall biosynthesis
LSLGMFDRIVPLILTFNEERNLSRVLSRLEWAGAVVVVDSYSDDGSEAIARSFNNVSFHQRPFDCLADQWNFGLGHAARLGEWVLGLDADYVLSDGLIDELGRLSPENGVAGFDAHFVYCIDGEPLRASLYPPHTVLFRAQSTRYVQDGHAQRLKLEGSVQSLAHPIYHDDRKSWSRWIANQRLYAGQEADKLDRSSWLALPISGKVRRIPLLSVLALPIYLIIGKGLWRDGLRGWKYIWQRLVAEWLIQRSLWMKARG